MEHTLQERLCAGLKARGYKRLDSVSRYEKFGRSDLKSKSTGRVYFIFVGKNGALRSGFNTTESRSIGDASRQTVMYTELLRAGDLALQGVVNQSTLDSF